MLKAPRVFGEHWGDSGAGFSRTGTGDAREGLRQGRPGGICPA